jgi:cell division protein FtsB
MERMARTAAWLLPFGLLVTAVVAVPLHIFDEEGLPRYRALHEELRQVREKNDRIRREVRELKREVRAVKNDPEAIERIARDELGMIRDDEIIFQFPK